MSSKGSSKSKNSSSTEESTEPNIAVKLRRLKITENLLVKDISKVSNDLDNETEDQYCFLDFKSLFNKLKNSYIDIRDLFEELKDNTSTEDNLQTLDIEEVKKIVINLEDKIKQFKTFLKSKLINLRRLEQELTKEIEEIPDELPCDMKQRQKVYFKPFTDIVPSPVKLLINSPFKCTEVQELQEFLSNSKNQYGGWIQYKHMIFVNCWQRHFNLNTNTENIRNSLYFHVFIQDVHRKCPDLSLEEIKLHVDWYMKYLYFKKRQQEAIEKWKRRKELLKTPLKQQSLRNANDSNKLCTKTSMEEKRFVGSESFSKDYVNELVSGELKKINGNISDEIKKCISTEHENAKFEHLINETINLDTSGLESVPTFSEVQMVHFVDKVVKTTIRPLLSYRNATEQWHNRCNAAEDNNPNYGDVETLSKRRIPKWRLGLHSKE